MSAIFTVDQRATFRMVFFMSTEPKMVFGSDRQQTNAAGTPKWEVQVVATFEQFGRATNEVLKVGIDSEASPTAALGGVPQAVELVNFRVGVMPVKEEQDPKNPGKMRVTGGQAFYQADAIRSTAAPVPAPSSKKQEG